MGDRRRWGGLAWAVALLASLVSGCAESHERGFDGGVPPAPDAAVSAPERSTLAWILVHPTDAPLGAGMYLYDLGRREVVRRLPLPQGVVSPHALAWDGASLWLSDVGEVYPSTPIYELDPADGTVRSVVRGIATQGLAIDGDSLWVAGLTVGCCPGWLYRIARDGSVLSHHEIAEQNVQDVVMANGALVYLAGARLVRVDPATGVTAELVSGVGIAPYALGFDGVSLVVASTGTLQFFDPATGSRTDAVMSAIPGWITAMAFVR